MSIVIQSKIRPEISVTVYPVKQYGGGNGYCFHDSGLSVYTQRELIEIGMADVVEELRPQANELLGIRES